MKRPAFQFYPADWRKDAALQSCSLAAQGLWMNMLCIAHECEPYGRLTINGRPMTAAQIGRLAGLSAAECGSLLTELADAGVSSMSEDGCIFSRRMVRDEELRSKRAAGGYLGAEHGAKGAEHGSKGGRPSTAKGGFEPPLATPHEAGGEPPLEPPPSSSSSSSSSPPSVDNTQRPKKAGRGSGGYSEDFERAWSMYPRKKTDSKQAAWSAWSARIRDGKTADAMICGVEAYAKHCAAEGREERFILNGSTFFGPQLRFEADYSINGTKRSHIGSTAGMDYKEGFGNDGEIL